jgi:hypothetical protein
MARRHPCPAQGLTGFWAGVLSFHEVAPVAAQNSLSSTNGGIGTNNHPLAQVEVAICLDADPSASRVVAEHVIHPTLLHGYDTSLNDLLQGRIPDT